MSTGSEDAMKKCIDTVCRLLIPGKGLLAADESLGTIARRFEPLGILSTPGTRRDYREMLFAVPMLAQHISGIILFEETLSQTNAEGRLFPDWISDLGIVPGIKVDRGTVPFFTGSRETITEGLDGLSVRLGEYALQGAKFAKWRGVIHIDETLPTMNAIIANAVSLARYARLCQDTGLVPIIEPEVLMDGSQNIIRSADVTRALLEAVFDALYAAGVCLEAIILKPNMVVPGAASGSSISSGEVAQQTLDVLRRCVPPAVPGIAFLSGGQSPDMATRHLRDMVRMGSAPWRLTFSYGRALQDEALGVWRGQAANIEEAQAILIARAKALSAAAHEADA
ncbi:class I fructose-bisphosphate aldolase [Polymorphobacter megasporae]|uniref:class I fructose-bisphosphate aldolase n=1 Tax=Glacieibacterium megasporae TaxID=2835787 RepID=UPI001CAA60B4|nr:class I fructose-bisphosphate aldolase [Polymorphobacter megasporae]UAJ10534.1 fructose-bisphosphate aldolase class I [Polymorphobacter megasporae]